MIQESKMSDDSIVRLDYVIFNGVKENYFSNSPLQVKIKFDPHFPFSVNDWVGLFKVGWISTEEKVCKKNIPKQAFDKLEYNLTLESDIFPEDEEEFFHLCYITQNDQLAGVSIPFQFVTNDFEIIDSCEQYDSEELCLKMREIEIENSKLKNEMESLQKEKEFLSKRIQELAMLREAASESDMGGKCLMPQKENMKLKRQGIVTPKASLVKTDSFSFMDEYYEDHQEVSQVRNSQSDVVRPIGFENLFPNKWVTYENCPDTAYPDPTWFPNPYINYCPGSNGPFNH